MTNFTTIEDDEGREIQVEVTWKYERSEYIEGIGRSPGGWYALGVIANHNGKPYQLNEHQERQALDSTHPHYL